MAKAKPGDVTGKMREQLANEHAEDLQARAAEMSLATAQAAEKLENEVIDATKPHPVTVIVDEAKPVGKQEDTVEIRVVENIESMTFGAGNHYSFKAGQKYRVTRAVAKHLEAKGYLANVL